METKKVVESKSVGSGTGGSGLGKRNETAGVSVKDQITPTKIPRLRECSLFGLALIEGSKKDAFIALKQRNGTYKISELDKMVIMKKSKNLYSKHDKSGKENPTIVEVATEKTQVTPRDEYYIPKYQSSLRKIRLQSVGELDEYLTSSLKTRREPVAGMNEENESSEKQA